MTDEACFFASVIVNVANWLKETFPSKCVLDIVLTNERPESFASYMVRRNGGVANRNILNTIEAADRLSRGLSMQLAEAAGDRAQFDSDTQA